MTLVVTLIIFIALAVLILKQTGLQSFTIGSAVSFVVAIVASLNPVMIILLALLTVISGITNMKSLRQSKVSKPFFTVFKKMLPHLSETEQEAIDAGTVWWDGDLFSGNPDWKNLTSIEQPDLTKDEKEFIEGPVTALCRISDAWKINHDWNVIPDHIIQFVRDNGFLSMIIPKKYGGLEFSAYAQSEVLIKLSNTGAAITYLVAVPNSLGPGELLLKYGTEEQKDYYLPRLSSGKEIPCFALTAPLAGSDATSIPDTGVVCKGMWKGEEIVGMKLNFNKRYITLAPVATLVGLAFKFKIRIILLVMLMITESLVPYYRVKQKA